MSVACNINLTRTLNPAWNILFISPYILWVCSSFLLAFTNGLFPQYMCVEGRVNKVPHFHFGRQFQGTPRELLKLHPLTLRLGTCIVQQRQNQGGRVAGISPSPSLPLSVFLQPKSYLFQSLLADDVPCHTLKAVWAVSVFIEFT